jgi:hypothetical protein
MIKQFLTLTALTILLTPAAASAQGVLLPKDSPSSGATGPVVNPLPQIAPKPQAPVPAAPLPNLNSGGYYGGQSQMQQMPDIYLPAAQQADMLQQAMTGLQDTEKNLGQNMNMNTQAAKGSPGSPPPVPDTEVDRQRNAAYKDQFNQVQQDTRQTANNYYSEIKKSQERLALLQSGPLKMSDFSRLYGY